jgi:riboflavin kinase/FMN adenylyltransferase
MRVFAGNETVPDAARGAVAAIGNFDGVHRGHRAVIERTGALAAERGAPLGVVTFEPHPRQFMRPDDPPFRLTPAASRTRLLDGLGVDRLYALRFDEWLRGLTAEAFVTEVLARRLGLFHAVVGYDFTFGHDRTGNVDVLRAVAGRSGIGVTVVEPVAQGGEKISSSAVREHLRGGEPDKAAKLLGHTWEIEGEVVQGDQRGCLLGFPTANVAIPPESLVPNLGVYAVRVALADDAAPAWRNGVANIGLRPTFGKDKVSLEAHVFDFDGDLYGKALRVAFIAFVRPEMKFAGLDALKAQIAADSETARKVLSAGSPRA